MSKSKSLKIRSSGLQKHEASQISSVSLNLNLFLHLEVQEPDWHKYSLHQSALLPEYRISGDDADGQSLQTRHAFRRYRMFPALVSDTPSDPQPLSSLPHILCFRRRIPPL